MPWVGSAPTACQWLWPGRFLHAPTRVRKLGQVLGRYVRENWVFDLAEAADRMARLPAETFGLVGGGSVAEGSFLDIVVTHDLAVHVG